MTVCGRTQARVALRSWRVCNATQAWNTRSITDGEGRPILNFMNGFSAGNVKNPNYSSGSSVAQLFGFDVVIDNNIPNLTASTTGGPVFGSLQHPMVYRQVRNAGLMRPNERYADFLAVGYLLFMRCDIRSNDCNWSGPFNRGVILLVLG